MQRTGSTLLQGVTARTALPASGKSDGEPLKEHSKLTSSAGEDRATLLGIAMMASSVPMFFLLGTTVLKPFMLRETVSVETLHMRCLKTAMSVNPRARGF
ncbi:hypothetical protein A6R68_03548, partial [Neotoma lepida]